MSLTPGIDLASYLVAAVLSYALNLLLYAERQGTAVRPLRRGNLTPQ